MPAWTCLALLAVAAVAAADDCVSPATCTPPPAKYASVLPLAPREQWGNSGGYCGAMSVQASALAYGTWISQDIVRKAAPPGGGHGDPADGYEILHTNIEPALRALKLAYDAFPYNTTAQPQSQAYMAWMKARLAAGHPVIWFILCKGDGHDTYGIAHYDHIEPVWALYSNHSLNDTTVYPDDVILHSSNWDQNTYYRPMHTLPDTLLMDGNCRDAVAHGGKNEAYPCIYFKQNYGYSITGPVDPAGVAKPIILDVGQWNEPDIKSGMPPAHLTGKLTVSELVAGSSYTIYKFIGAETVPVDSQYAKAPYVSKYAFQATGSVFTWTDPVPFLSSNATYYRCVQDS